MSDRWILPIYGVGVLALDTAQFAAALAAGNEVSQDRKDPLPATELQLLDSDAMAARLGVPKTWLEKAARDGEVPVIQAGKYRRYDPAAVFAALGGRSSQVRRRA
jgi:hypothetical protein